MAKKITIIFYICFIFCFLTPCSVLAHPGRTDSNGGHYNHSTGEYHYHHGYSAHQHIDGVCPYAPIEFEQDETKQETDSDGSISYVLKKREQDSSDAKSKAEEESSRILKEDNNNNIKNSFIFDFSDFFTIIFYIFSMIIIIIKVVIWALKKCQEKLYNKKLKLFRQHLSDNIYSHYFSMYAFYHPLDFVKVPEGSFLKDGLPATKGNGKYGDYTVYMTPKGECFHQNPQCFKNLEARNYVYAYRRRPCKRCVKNRIPKVQWYFDYVKIKKIKKDYNIP